MASEPTTPTPTPKSPTTPSDDHEATREWLEGILESYHQTAGGENNPTIQLDEWNIKPASVDREGFLSEQLSVAVTYTVGGEGRKHAHLLAKLLPQDPFNRAFVIETLFDVREIKFYTEIKPALDKIEKSYLVEDEQNKLWTPTLYYAKHKEGTESIIVLEDMCQQSYKVEDLTSGLSQIQIKAAIDAAANFHAMSLVLEKKEKVQLSKEYPYLLSTVQAVESFTCLVGKGVPLLLKYLESRKDFVAVREGLNKYSDRNVTAELLKKVLAPSDKLNTLVHCDYWCNNLLFKDNGDSTKCCIIDWQMITYGRPAIDIALLISTSLNVTGRRKHTDELLMYYWDSFTSRLAKFGIDNESLGYSKDNFVDDFQSAQAMAALVVVGSVDIALGIPAREERVLELLKDMMSDKIL